MLSQDPMARLESFPVLILLMQLTHPLNSSMECWTFAFKSQTLTVLSIDPETKSLSWQVSPRDKTSLVCPWNLCWVVNLVRSHNLKVLSQDPEKKCLLVECIPTQETKWLWPWRALYGFPTGVSTVLPSSPTFFWASKSNFQTIAFLSLPPEIRRGDPSAVCPTSREVTWPLWPIWWINFILITF